MNPIRAAIYSRLAADTTLTGLLSTPTAIYHGFAPQGAKFPLVVFSKQAGTPTWAFSSASFQSDVWLVKAIGSGTTASGAEDIAARVAVVLTDAPLSITGGVLLGVWRESDIDYDEVDAGVQYWHSGAQYRLVTQPA